MIGTARPGGPDTRAPGAAPARPAGSDGTAAGVSPGGPPGRPGIVRNGDAGSAGCAFPGSRSGAAARVVSPGAPRCAPDSLAESAPVAAPMESVATPAESAAAAMESATPPPGRL